MCDLKNSKKRETVGLVIVKDKVEEISFSNLKQKTLLDFFKRVQKTGNDKQG